MQHEPLVLVERSGFPVGVHYASALALTPTGQPIVSIGDVDAQVLPRSAIKPLQTLAMLEAGLALPPPLLALASGSHSGEPQHLEGVKQILRAAHLDEGALQNPPDLPLGESERLRWLGLSREPERIAQNCSGQHAAMLAACVANGWDTRTYLEAEHPLQRKIALLLAELAGEKIGDPRADGCGAPNYPVSLRGLARCFSRIARSPHGTNAEKLASAIRTYPELVAGDGRPSLLVAKAVPGLLGKEGAEAVYVGALPDGSSVAIKIADGGLRALWPAVIALLMQLDNRPILRLLAERFGRASGTGNPLRLRVIGLNPVADTHTGDRHAISPQFIVPS